MDKQKDGRSAFPMIESDTHGDGRVFHFSTGGMSLRDYFAAQVLNGMLASDVKRELKVSEMVRLAYKIADAMIAERENHNDQL